MPPDLLDLLNGAAPTPKETQTAGAPDLLDMRGGRPAALPRRDVPDATVGSVARDIAAGALQIGPTAIKSMADIARLFTGDRVGKDTSETMERGMGAIRDTVGSERAVAQRENFQRDMADDEVGIGEALIRNKGALADQLLPTIGSMFLPVGVAGAAGKVATATRAAKALDAAALAARVAAAQKAAGVGATAAQNAASTFAELVDKGVPMQDAYVGAGITVPFSVVAGALTGGGAEVAAVRALTGTGAAKAGVKQLLKAPLKEGGQEMGEELGQIAGEGTATGEMPSAVGAGKQLAVAGTLGAAMGAGVDVATQAGQRTRAKAAPPDTEPHAEAPAAPRAVEPVPLPAGTPAAAMDQNTPLDSAQDTPAAAQPDIVASSTGPNPGQQGDRGALAQRMEAQAELAAAGDVPASEAASPAAAGELADVTGTPFQQRGDLVPDRAARTAAIEAQEPVERQAQSPERIAAEQKMPGKPGDADLAANERHDAAQIRRGATASKVEQAQAAPAVAAAAPAGTVPGSVTVQAKTFPQYQLERGFKPSGMRKGTPEWDTLLAEWAAITNARAGTNPEGSGSAGVPARESQKRGPSHPASGQPRAEPRQSHPVQGSSQPVREEPAGGRTGGAGMPMQQHGADRAGLAADEAGGRGQGQEARDPARRDPRHSPQLHERAPSGNSAAQLSRSPRVAARQPTNWAGEGNGPQLLYSIGDNAPPGRGLSVEQAQQAVQEALAGLASPPPIDIVARSEELGVDAPDGVMGAAIPGERRIIIVASAHRSAAGVVETLFHEMFHLGVRNVLPASDYVGAMLDLAKSDSRVQEYAIRWKKEAPDAPRQLQVLRERGYTGSELTAEYEALAIEEGLAVVAEELRARKQAGTRLGPGVRSLANWLATVAERMGMWRLAARIRKMTYNEAERFVLAAIDHAGSASRRPYGADGGGSFRAAGQTEAPESRRRFGWGDAGRDSVALGRDALAEAVAHELALATYTPREVAAREDAQQQAQQLRAGEKAAAAQRAQADADRDSFALTGRDREADVAAAQGQAPMFSRSPATQANYETRIDALFAGEKPKPQGVRVLDRSDMLSLLGISDGPVHVVESKVEQGRFNHGLSAADWKKVPQWLDNPVAVFDSDTTAGRLVFIAPELVRGAPVRMVIDPRPDGGGVNLLINAYDAERNPFQRWERDGLMRYFDKQKAPSITGSFQPRLTGLPGDRGRGKILTEKHLAGWRRANSPAFSQMDRRAHTADDFGVDAIQQAMDERGPAAAEVVARAQAQVDAIRANWKNAPEVVVVATMQDAEVPQRVRDHDAEQKSQGATGEPEGFFYRGKVYIVAGQVSGPRDVARVLFHEALGHYGLRGVFGEALRPILQQIASIRAQEVRLKAEQYGLDWGLHADRLVAAEEVLAEMAEKSPQRGFVRRAVAAVRTFLRQNVPGFEKLRVSDAEIIRDYILPARGWVERGAQQAADAERAGRHPAFEPAFSLAEDGGRKALAEFAKADDLFALPKSDKDTVAGIAGDHPGGIKVGKPVSFGGRVEYALTMKDGSTATLSVREPNPYGGEQVYDTRYTDDGAELVAGRPGENPEDVPSTGDVWIDVSSLKTGDDGAAVYNIAATFAHNTGRIFIGDPHGLSAVALRRRLEHMISSALKFGTTAHLAPHPDQVRGGHGVPALRWVYGDDVGNVERMIAASVKALDNAFPSSKKIAYDPDRGFYNAVTGSSVDRAELGVVWGRAAAAYRMAHGAGATGQAGWRTVARAALFRHLQSTLRAGTQPGRGELLDRGGAELARLERGGFASERDGAPFDKKQRIFYSRGPAGGGVNPGGPTPPPFRDKLSKLQDKVRELTGYSSVDDALYAWQDKFIDLKRIQARIKALNGVVSETNDAYRGEELYHKRVA